MEEFEKIVNEFTEVTKKLQAWFDYYKEEDLLKMLDRPGGNLVECIGTQITQLQADAVLLGATSELMKMNLLFLKMRNSL